MATIHAQNSVCGWWKLCALQRAGFGSDGDNVPLPVSSVSNLVADIDSGNASDAPRDRQPNVDN
eukprot:8522478-Karenia_brevis.AAC.1